MKASSLNLGPPFPEMQCIMQSESSLGDLHNEWKYVFFHTRVQTQLLIKNKINKAPCFPENSCFFFEKTQFFLRYILIKDLSFYKVDYIQIETRVA